jgi:hypothetical protein
VRVRRNGYPFVDPAKLILNDGNSINGKLTVNNPVPEGEYYIFVTTNQTQLDAKLVLNITRKYHLFLEAH